MKSSELDWIPSIRTLETFRFLWSPLFESNNQKISFNLYIVSTFAKSCYLALSVIVMFLRRRIVFTQTSPFYISRNCCNENILSAHCILAEWDNGRASCCLRLILPFNLTAEHIILYRAPGPSLSCEVLKFILIPSIFLWLGTEAAN